MARKATEMVAELEKLSDHHSTEHLADGRLYDEIEIALCRCC